MGKSMVSGRFSLNLTGAKRREWMGMGVAGIIIHIFILWIIPSFPTFSTSK